jgi:3-deoxy-D-manno-octulosonic-acid transferase
VDPLAIFHGVYQVLGGIIAAPAMFFSSLSGRGGGFWLDRLGCPAAGGGKPYWLHAASVGEAGSAAAIIRAWKELEPEASFVLSVGTPAGRAHAESALSAMDCVQFMAPPLDVWGAPGRCLARVDPRALVIIETEIWPGLIRACHKRRVPVILAAGRISARTCRRFGWVKSFFRQVLNFMERLLVISDADRERFLSLGVDPAKVEVLGSPKFDGLIARARGPAPRPIVNAPPYLLVAGSTHPGEEEILISELLKTLLGRALHSQDKPKPPPTYAIMSGPEVLEAWKDVRTETDLANVARDRNDRTEKGIAEDDEADAERSGKTGHGDSGTTGHGDSGMTGHGDSGMTGPDDSGKAGTAEAVVPDATIAAKPVEADAPERAGTGSGVSEPESAPASEKTVPDAPASRPETAMAVTFLQPESRESEPSRLHPGNPFKLIIVPRHVHRAKEVAELARKKGFQTEILTDPEIPFSRLPEIGVFAAVGHLLRLYERCDLSIVCGSFVSGLQGHNPLEPSSVARPMIFGPNMMSFHEQARALMEQAACIMVVPNTVHTVLSEYAKDPHIAQVSGRRGRAYVASLSPVAPLVAQAIRKALGAPGTADASPAASDDTPPAASSDAVADASGDTPSGEAAGEGR